MFSDTRERGGRTKLPGAASLTRRGPSDKPLWSAPVAHPGTRDIPRRRLDCPDVSALHTAAAIARVRSEEGALPEGQRLFEDPLARHFAGDDADTTALMALQPFFRAHVRLRTRFIDDAVSDALTRGSRHLVLLGAGFDCRALRLTPLARNSALVFEVDHAEQLQKKADILANAGARVPPWVFPVPADFNRAELEEDLPARLEATGFDRTKPTLFVGEGLIGYLDLAAVERLARVTAALSAAGSRLILTYHRIGWHPDVVNQTLMAGGWTPDPAPSYAELHQRHLGTDAPEQAADYSLTCAVKRA
jgi:methyltransferase (TIGR00027 family)